MDIVIAGAHGQIARLLVPRLVARGDRVRGLIRNPDHAVDVKADGADAVVIDLESATDEDVDGVIAGTDAIVFAAGAGPGSSAERKWTVDHGAARLLIDAAVRNGVRRYVMISSIGTDDPPSDDGVFSVYLRAKAKADEDLRAAGLDHTIVRPGRLTDDPGTGRVAVDRHLPLGSVSRDDVAAVLAAVLPEAGTHGRTFVVMAGDLPVAEVPGAVSAIDPDTAAT